jgi:subtilisin-like proprotein convertase family protein
MSSRRVVWTGALLGTFLLAFGALGVAGAAKKKTKTKTFSSGNLSLPIEDAGDVAIGKVNVGKKGKVKDVNLSVRLDHSDLGDLDMHLLSTGGRTAHFWDNEDPGFASDEDFGTGPNSCAGSRTTFDDEGSPFDEIGDDPAGHVGKYQLPQGSLSSFDGSNMRGAWYLLVQDTVGGDDGTLGCVDLKIKYKKKKK